MDSEKECHVMLFPWLAFGHMIPFLELGKKLASKAGVRVTFISTPRNVQRLPQVPMDLADRVKMVALTLPPVDGLDENCQSSMDLKDKDIPYLKIACDGLKQQFEELLVKDLPDVVLFDFFQYWGHGICAKFGVPTSYFSVFPAATLLSFTGPLEKLKEPASPGGLMKTTYTCDIVSGLSSVQRLALTLEGCDFVAVRSCTEFEGSDFDVLEKRYLMPVLPVGMILPESKTEDEMKRFHASDTFQWLEKQEAKSVLFVGFGSEYKMSAEQIHELAHGIEMSGVPFIWAVRIPEGVHSDDNLMPSGFMSRTSDRGMVCIGWAPQFEILAHSSIGGCLFHSGWGSIIESLSFGHPLVLMPMMADQFIYARILPEMGLGFAVPRHEDGSFDREAVATSVRTVMVDQKGESIKLKAANMRSVFGNRDLHDSCIDKLVKLIRTCKSV